MSGIIVIALCCFNLSELSLGVIIRLYANYVSIIIVLVNIGFVKGAVVFTDKLTVGKKKTSLPKDRLAKV